MRCISPVDRRLTPISQFDACIAAIAARMMASSEAKAAVVCCHRHRCHHPGDSLVALLLATRGIFGSNDQIGDDRGQSRFSHVVMHGLNGDGQVSPTPTPTHQRR